MRLHAASPSPSITRTLEAIILASGHTLANWENAELILLDPLNALVPDRCPYWTLGHEGNNQPALSFPLRPQHLKRLLATKLVTQTLRLGHGWAIDILSRNLIHADHAGATLTEKECALLKSLQQAFPATISRDALLADVWGITHAIDTHTLETHIYRLRHKLEGLTPAPCDILTEGGSYRLIGIES